jgi:hypothetical protein
MLSLAWKEMAWWLVRVRNGYRSSRRAIENSMWIDRCGSFQCRLMLSSGGPSPSISCKFISLCSFLIVFGARPKHKSDITIDVWENDWSVNRTVRELSLQEWRFISSRGSEDIHSTDRSSMDVSTFSVSNMTDMQNSICQAYDREIYISTCNSLAHIIPSSFDLPRDRGLATAQHNCVVLHHEGDETETNKQYSWEREDGQGSEFGKSTRIQLGSPLIFSNLHTGERNRENPGIQLCRHWLAFSLDLILSDWRDWIDFMTMTSWKIGSQMKRL